MTKALILLTSLAICSMPALSADIYTTTFSDQSDVKMLNVDFNRSKPPPKIANKALRSSLDTAIAVDPSTNIVATLFYRDSMVRDAGYTSQLVYMAEQGKVVTFAEYMERR